MVAAGATPPDHAATGMKLVLARPSRPQEIERLVALCTTELAQYRKRGESEPELAAWTMVANVLLISTRRSPRNSWRAQTIPPRRHRRHFFEQASFGIGGLALASLIDEALLAQGSRPPAYKFDYPPKVKHVVYLFMAGRRRSSICSIPSRR